MVFRVLHEVPSAGIKLMYVRKRMRGGEEEEKGTGEGIMNYLKSLMCV